MADKPTYEELLREAGYDTDPEPADPDAGSSEESSSFKQLRAAEKRAAKERDAYRKQVEELAAQVAERDERDAKATLAQAGLTEKQAEVFRKAYDSVTPETLQAFQEVLGAREETPSTPSFQPTQSNSGETFVNHISKTEFENMMRDPKEQALAQNMAERGLVDWTRRT